MRKIFYLKFFTFILIAAFLFNTSVAFAALSCTVTTTCTSPSVVVLRMDSVTNSHAELPGQSNYSELLCCSGVSGLSNSCSDTFSVVLRLSSATNAHVEENTQTTTTYNGSDACLSVPAGSVTIGYQNNNCTGFDETVASIAKTPTNAHIGDAASYTRKVCATVTTSGVIVPAGGSGGGGSAAYNYGCRIADFNCDGRVDILDFSILLYYSAQTGTDITRYDLSHDGVIDLSDISIMFYYWDIEE